jgi:hypothetical protein
MSDQKILFEDFTQIQTGTWSIAGIGDTHLQVLGKGHITVTVQVDNQSSTRVIKDVLYVPGLGTNLFRLLLLPTLDWKLASPKIWSRFIVVMNSY